MVVLINFISKEREARMDQLQENLSERELMLDERKLILDIAFRINDFR